MKRTIFLFFLFFCTHSFAQKVAIKNNLAYDALKTPNLSLEFSMGRKWKLDTQVGMNFFSTRRMLPPPGIKQRRLVTGWYSLNYVTGRVMFSMVGSSGYTRMEGR